MKLTSRKIDVKDVLAEVSDPSAGGTSIFIGTVRDRDRGTRVVGLEYDAYDRMALAKMKEIEREARRRWAVKRMAIFHRKGRLRVGDISVVVAVSAEHRAQAIEACRFAIDSLKQTVPIWKREMTASGAAGWVEGVGIRKLQLMRGARTRKRG